MSTGHEKSKGYANRAYAESLSQFGELIHLPRCGGYLLKRSIPGTSDFDAMGSYPLFFCEDWSLLNEDLATLPEEIISVSIVADPFGAYSRKKLERDFDVVNPYKVHYIVDLDKLGGKIGSHHHRKEARSALKEIQVEVCKDPAGFADRWIELYQTLSRRHDIHGIRAFSRTAFEQQLRMPEIIVHQAFHQGEIVGAQLYYMQGNVVHCHLGAVSDKGYKVGAFYAMDYYAAKYFSGTARKLDLGGGAGLSGANSDGLSRYKKGWSSETHPVYFCGRITNSARYDALAPLQGQENTNYFPAYRFGEFK
ncbi:GNAT family N-acetyltransferase [Pontiella sulfatireligans]|uniref:BioF2-like acetyltransferase domain-containing protein n=1 Tax=Pontiella sulfatireligans TaxID=2750658 RepID=A0A6C2UMX2_9BACT|nr:GNAT family N-acetyltransferase [Pontiella sulfatireligans]VGO21293.1 hypothetical protein SCARR_03365 [Pontiella sulfatireligans]